MNVVIEKVRTSLNRFGWDVCKSFRLWVKPLDILDLAIKSINHDQFFFVQVGANDGVSFDPIREHVLKYRWKGILIEPQKDIFAKLQQNYKTNGQLILENCAIVLQEGPVTMYRPTTGETDTLARVTRDQLKGPVETEKVAGLTLESLLKKHKVQHVDFLQVDAEGFDDQIVKQSLALPENLRPRLIHFETGWYSNKRIISLYTELDRQGYKIYHGKGLPDNDTVALK